MKPPRGLTDEEAEAWARLAASVTPLKAVLKGQGAQARQPAPAPAPQRAGPANPLPAPLKPFTVGSRSSGNVAAPNQPGAGQGRSPRRGGEDGNLDSHWERRLSRAASTPDFTLDLHGHTLDQAHARLDHGIGQAKAMGARLVLIVTGKSRPVDAADRGSRRGAIRAKILDWLAAGPHASDIAAIRKAHRRHGGEGAIYIVLKRNR